MSATTHRFKEITVVPPAKELVDITLSKTQRKTPTQIHPHFKIHRIRSFYMRKVKFCQQAFYERLTGILTQFPRLDDIHPFYGDLLNVLYDRDHFKLALGQVNSVRGAIDGVGKDYVRLLKYADSTYKCKMLKRAALGRMCTATRKLASSLVFLEEVRQHLGRLPTIDPNARSLIICGFPNVGKSSFMNKVSLANVEVQPYAFTTKSLYVGHFDHEYNRWQVVDTPGILDHPLECRNTIEMTSITALAHIQATMLYFVDISEQCGWSIEAQVNLFKNIMPLFNGKPLLVVLNKTDIRKVDDLNPDEKRLLESMKEGMESIEFLQTSCITTEGVDACRDKACELLLSRRISTKVEGKKVDSIMNRLHMTAVVPRQDRPPSIPDTVTRSRNMGEVSMGVKRETEKDLQNKYGGAGVYSVDLRKSFDLKDPSWKYDLIPEIMDGRNVADFVDPDIEEKLLALEKEEDLLLNADDGMDEGEDEFLEMKARMKVLHTKIADKKELTRMNKSNNHVRVPRRKSSLRDVKSKLAEIGYEPAPSLSTRAVRPPDRSLAIAYKSLKQKRKSSAMEDIAGEDSLVMQKAKKIREASSHRRLTPGRFERGLSKPEDQAKAIKAVKKEQQKFLRTRKKGEADRFIGTKMPRHLFSGKRGIGKTDRR